MCRPLPQGVNQRLGLGVVRDGDDHIDVTSRSRLRPRTDGESAHHGPPVADGGHIRDEPA